MSRLKQLTEQYAAGVEGFDTLEEYLFEMTIDVDHMDEYRELLRLYVSRLGSVDVH